VPTCLKKTNIEKKQPKSQTIFLTPTASKKSQICKIWRQKIPSGNPMKSWHRRLKAEEMLPKILHNDCAMRNFFQE